MKITAIRLSIFELKSNTKPFRLVEDNHRPRLSWRRREVIDRTEQVHVLHVLTDEDVEGVCTVGDARYTTMRREEFEQLKLLALGEDPLDRERLYSKLSAATRGMFSKPGWFGAFDNCLWDIAGKIANLPVYKLIGPARTRCPAYYNIASHNKEAAIKDAQRAVDQGFQALKDHFRCSSHKNIELVRALRDEAGSDIELFHDAVGANYSYFEALQVGRVLEKLHYGWFEEPLSDYNLSGLKKLCSQLDIPILSLESLMHNIPLSAQYLLSGATDYVRANARHGTTSILKLAHFAELFGTNIELNGPGGLFGLVHAHLVCAIPNTRYYEYFPGGSRDELGKTIGLENPPLPVQGDIEPPSAPGWGVQWNWDLFETQRVAVLT